MAPFRAHTLRRSGLWQNNWLISLVVIVILINIMTTIYMLLSVKPVIKPVPIHYTSLTNFDVLGSWFMLYRLPLMSWLVACVNIYIAGGVYHRSRITSVMLIVASLIFALLTTQTAIFFIGVGYGPR